MSNSLHRNPEFKNVTCSQSFRMSSLCMLLRAYPIMRRAQIAPSDFSSGEADFPQEPFVDFKGKRRSMTEKIPASCVRIISGSALNHHHK